MVSSEVASLLLSIRLRPTLGIKGIGFELGLIVGIGLHVKFWYITELFDLLAQVVQARRGWRFGMVQEKLPVWRC